MPLEDINMSSLHHDKIIGMQSCSEKKNTPMAWNKPRDRTSSRLYWKDDPSQIDIQNYHIINSAIKPNQS